jgi:hypothetical protein
MYLVISGHHAPQQAIRKDLEMEQHTSEDIARFAVATIALESARLRINIRLETRHVYEHTERYMAMLEKYQQSIVQLLAKLRDQYPGTDIRGQLGVLIEIAHDGPHKQPLERLENGVRQLLDFQAELNRRELNEAQAPTRPWPNS